MSQTNLHSTTHAEKVAGYILLAAALAIALMLLFSGLRKHGVFKGGISATHEIHYQANLQNSTAADGSPLYRAV
jgi:hypothetical protein